MKMSAGESTICLPWYLRLSVQKQESFLLYFSLLHEIILVKETLKRSLKSTLTSQPLINFLKVNLNKTNEAAGRWEDTQYSWEASFYF